jgi:hypothetical protein
MLFLIVGVISAASSVLGVSEHIDRELSLASTRPSTKSPR